MDNTEKILAKIKKCLALAKSSNPHEAAVALKQAQKLMEEHGISQSEIKFTDINTHQSSLQPTINRTKWDWSLIHTVGRAFGCTCILVNTWNKNTHKEGSAVSFIGAGCAPELATYTYNVLRRQLVKARTHYANTALKRIIRKNKTASADLFCVGWVTEVSKQVRNFANPTQSEILQEYIKHKFPNAEVAKTIDRKPTRTDGYSDRISGAVAANDVQLHRPIKGQNNAALGFKS